MNIYKNILSYIFSIVLLLFVLLWIDFNKLSVLFQIPIYNIILSILFAFTIFLLTGLMYFVSRLFYNVKMSKTEIIIFPIAMNFWNYIFPFQGSFIFNTFYFKIKHCMNIKDSFSINTYIYIINIIFIGLFGLLYVYLNDMIISYITILFILCTLSPFLLYIIKYLAMFKFITKSILIKKFLDYIVYIIDNTHNLLINIKYTLYVFILNIIRLIINILWFFWISSILKFDLSFIEVGIIALIMNASVIIKITPGNLGINQFLAGGLMNFFDNSPDFAIIITLFATATTMFISFTFGLLFNIYIFNNINIFKILKYNSIKNL